MYRLIRFALCFGAALLPCGPLFAMAVQGPCDKPFVFAGADLNVVVLPYSQPASLGATTPQVGTQLGRLVELETLLGIAKFGSIGLVQLVGDPERECTPENVLQRLGGTLQPGHALIMVWGRIFESGSNLYLQSYVRFLRRGSTETIDFSIGGRALPGRLSSQSLGSAPRKIALSDLDRIGEQYVASNFLRAAPDSAAAHVAIPEDRGPYSFWITEVRGDWVQLAPSDADKTNLPRGWVLARAQSDGLSLRQLMPELTLIEGIAGYLSARVRDEVRPLQAADAALSQYLERWRSGAFLAEPDTAASGMTLAVAIPEQLRGFIAVLRSSGEAGAYAAAHEHFQRAAALMPYSGSARNLAAISGAALAFADRQPERAPRQFLGELIAAVNNDPANSEALANLAQLYELVLSPPGQVPARWNLQGAERETLTRESAALRGP